MGPSDKPQQDYTIPGFADDLAWMIRALSLDRPVLIGHSMGGAACLELAAEHPELVGGVVVLDTAVMPGPDAWAGIQRVLKTLQTDNYAEELRQFFSTAFFLPGDNSERKARIVEEMVATPKHVLALAFANIFEWDSAVAVARCRVPAVYIGSSRPRGDYAQISKTNPSMVFGQVVGSGHFVQLEVPDQVNSMIPRFLELYMPGPER